MLNAIGIQDILFLDIETVPSSPDFDSLSPVFQQFWEKKSSYFRKENETAADVYQRAGIYAEFGKIICISAGLIFYRGKEKMFRVKSFFGDEENIILSDFSGMLEAYSSRKGIYLCAHNGKEFDFPYLARRILLNALPLPGLLDVAGKKPWEVSFLDTLELWKFGDYKHYASLDLLTRLFGIPTPKEDIDGSMVYEIYWKHKDLNRIVDYCEKDVLAVAQLFLRYRGDELMPADNVERIRD